MEISFQYNILICFYVVCIVLMKCQFGNSDEGVEKNLLDQQFFTNFTQKDIEAYFTVKRKKQTEAINVLMDLKKYEHRYQVARQLFEKIFDLVENSRIEVEKSDYVLGDELPRSPVTEHILQTIEKCAFFGNLVLKLPDISDRLLKINNHWVDSYKWCFKFTMSSNLLDEVSLKMFNLAAQQLKLIPRSADFVNPYEKNSRSKGSDISKNTNKPKVKKTLHRSKGPRMSRSEL